MAEAFPEDSPFKLRKFVSSYYSNGLLPRLKAVLEARRRRSDINHITGDVHFLALGLPGRRTLLTIHDIGFLRDYRGWKRALLKWFWLDWPVRHCRLVVAVSDATRRDILANTRCRPEKILVIPTLIAAHFRPIPKHFNAEKPCILHIGLAPNKNFERHLQALQGIPCRLHIIGKLEERHLALLRHFQIEYTNAFNLSDEEMLAAYAASDLLLFASTLEGFGMPILEAQAVGRPVITSNCSSMPEVAGPGACLVDPFDVASIRAGILRVIQNADYRAELLRLGQENAKRFSAEEVARRYAGVYGEMYLFI
jgi:glycosyltransferase involved in cell wall biosynthesis